MAEYLLIRLEGPLQAWGDVAIDQVRPSGAFPTKSALAGLVASALGWTYRDGVKTNQLQDAIEYAAREDRRPEPLQDFQSIDLGREAGGWTHWGYEGRGGSQKTGTHLMEKGYLADGSFLVALTVVDGPVTLAELETALRMPARPLFLGRKSCPPARRLCEGRVTGVNALDVLSRTPVRAEYDRPPLRCWSEPGRNDSTTLLSQEVWDRRDFESDLFAGSRTVIELTVEPTIESTGV